MKNKIRFCGIALTAVIGFSMAACNMGIDDTSKPDITRPDTSKPDTSNPDTLEPNIVADYPEPELPQVDDNDLIGNADTAGADAVIILKRTTAEFTGTNVNIVQSDLYGTIVEISKSGTYVIQGTLEQGFVAVSKKDLNVTLVLNGVNIFCKNYAAITCLKKSNVTIVLAENSANYLTDGGEGADADGKYGYGYDSDEAPNAALLIRKDLTIKGPGKLIVKGGANNGIGSRANLKIEGGDITVTGKNNAIKGNDSITVTGGTFNLNSWGDGIKTDEDSVAEGLANINITGGDFTITAVNDAVETEAGLTITGANFKIKSGGGSSVAATTASAKGLKAGTDLVINSGTFNIDSNDDSIHSNGTVTINGGTFNLASGDDGIHADTRLTVNGGTINISKCYEGLESYDIDLNGGFVKIKASDDGINIAGGKDASASAANRPGQGGFRPGQPGGGGQQAINGTLTITGGEYYVESAGDGLDSNGSIVMKGGTVVVCGPTADPEVPIDYDGTFVMTGGTLVATGIFGSMAQQPGSSSAQYTFMAKFSSAVAAGSLINVSSASGAEIVTVKVGKAAKGIVVCSPLLEKGTTYKISSGGSHSGTVNALNLLVNGTYSGGAVLKTVTLNSIATTVN